MIKIKDLFKNYGRNVVLTGLDLHIGGNGIFAVLGPNGSGKTTLIKCILGMVLPQSGSISISDEPVENQWKYREIINYQIGRASSREVGEVEDVMVTIIYSSHT